VNPPASEKTCAITGTTGYLGGRLKSAFQQRNWRVIDLNRRPVDAGSSHKPFRLGDDPQPESFSGARALIHCAYDFKQLAWSGIHASNVAGSEKLFRAAVQAGVKKLIYISSISAFDGCKSLYGKAKLETERIAFSFGAWVIRPGLIWGDPPGAMFGRLVDQVKRAWVLPLTGGGGQIQYLVHHEELADFICHCAENRDAPLARPVTIAHEQPWTFRQILEEIAAEREKRLAFIPVPWRLVWCALKAAELCHVPLDFRSDSLVSLSYQNPTPSFAEQRELQIRPRPFGRRV
jgi:nucleoside-diphosphate-sugar epimerase